MYIDDSSVVSSDRKNFIILNLGSFLNIKTKLWRYNVRDVGVVLLPIL